MSESTTADAAYQGAAGAFSEDAARAMLGTAARLQPYRTLQHVFEALAEGRAASAVVPQPSWRANSFCYPFGSATGPM